MDELKLKIVRTLNDFLDNALDRGIPQTETREIEEVRNLLERERCPNTLELPL